MTKRLIFLLLFLPFLLSGQIIQNTDYNQGSYCFSNIGGNNSISIPTTAGNIYNDGEICFYFKKLGLSGGAYHPIISRFNVSIQGYQIFIPNSTNQFSLYTNAVHTFNYIVDTDLHFYRLVISGNSATLWVDGIEQQTINSITFLNIPTAAVGFNSVGKYSGTSINGLLYNFYVKVGSNINYYYPMSEASYDFPTFYDVSGNGNHGTASGTNYRTTCTENTYNADNGMTKVVYGANTVLVPYLLDGTSQYSAVSPVLNAAEKYINYPASFWGKKIVTNNGKIVKQ